MNRKSIFCFALVCCCAAVWSCGRHGNAFPYSGTLEAESASVGSPVGGRVVAVLVQAGSRVRAGQIIVRFNDAAQRADSAAASAQVAQARASLADVEAGPRRQDVERAAAEESQAYAAY